MFGRRGRGRTASGLRVRGMEWNGKCKWQLATELAQGGRQTRAADADSVILGVWLAPAGAHDRLRRLGTSARQLFQRGISETRRFMRCSHTTRRRDCSSRPWPNHDSSLATGASLDRRIWLPVPVFVSVPDPPFLRVEALSCRVNGFLSWPSAPIFSLEIYRTSPVIHETEQQRRLTLCLHYGVQKHPIFWPARCRTPESIGQEAVFHRRKEKHKCRAVS